MEAGRDENTNGLLWQYLPKGTGLSLFSQDELDAIAYKLYARPCMVHGFKSPSEICAEMTEERSGG